MASTTVGNKEYIDTEELSIRWDKSPKTIAFWRQNKKGPGFYRFGEGSRRKVWYDLDEIREYENTKLDQPVYTKIGT